MSESGIISLGTYKISIKIEDEKEEDYRIIVRPISAFTLETLGVHLVEILVILFELLQKGFKEHSITETDGFQKILSFLLKRGEEVPDLITRTASSCIHFIKKDGIELDAGERLDFLKTLDMAYLADILVMSYNVTNKAKLKKLFQSLIPREPEESPKQINP
jgi:hypothetical protein